MQRQLIAIISMLSIFSIACRDVESERTQDSRVDVSTIPLEVKAQAPFIKTSTQPSFETLSRNPVIGALAIPLGTVVEIQATVVDGDELRMMAYQGDYLLRVTEVDGHTLDPAPVLEFTVPAFVGVELANDAFDLYKMKTGNKAGALESTQIDELESDYVGKQVRLVVFEVGAYSGIPANLPDDVPMWHGRGFGFRTSLVVLAERQ